MTESRGLTLTTAALLASLSENLQAQMLGPQDGRVFYRKEPGARSQAWRWSSGRVEPVPPALAESRQDRSWVMSADHVQGHYQPAFSENDIPLLGGSGPVGRRPPVHHFSSTLTWYPPNISWASALGCSVESI